MALPVNIDGQIDGQSIMALRASRRFSSSSVLLSSLALSDTKVYGP